jgi:phospholipid/cholesterol/gamma-HCH transport system ATP-binding protein
METAKPTIALHVEDLRKGFNGKSILSGIDLEVPRGSIFSVLGPSGTGKSVFLKCLANILQPDAGRIRFDGLELSAGDSSARDEFRRRCSFLFQSNALFDSLTALENVALPLEQTTTLGRMEILNRCRDA